MRQLIIVRKDLNMSIGKTAVQCCHASQAWLFSGVEIRQYIRDTNYYYIKSIDADTHKHWIGDIATKTICGVKNKTQLLKATIIAQELGLKENKDYFLIYDRCLTELTPEEQDEDGGKTLTCIGFRPLEDEVVHKISKKFQLL